MNSSHQRAGFAVFTDPKEGPRMQVRIRSESMIRGLKPHKTDNSLPVACNDKV